mgnify:CR=1 FL=1
MSRRSRRAACSPAAGAFEGARGFVGIAFRAQDDGERYEALAAATFDDDSAYPDDYRNLISVGPFAALAAGETLDGLANAGDYEWQVELGATRAANALPGPVGRRRRRPCNPKTTRLRYR